MRINPALANILIGNLLKNAIRHNIDSGWIKVKLLENKLVISNSGAEPPMPTTQLFERFRKSNNSGKSMGLGLAIVQKICAVHEWKISYQYAAGVHEIAIIL